MSDKIDGKTVKLLHGLIDAGASKKLLDDLPTEHDAPFLMAAVHALVHRLTRRSQTPSPDHFSPILLGWNLDAAKKEWCGRGKGVVDWNSLPLPRLMTLEQPESPLASCSIIQSLSDQPLTFDEIVGRLSWHRAQEKFFKRPDPAGSVDHCFCMQHALKIIGEIFLGLSGMKLRISGLIPHNALQPGQSLVVPVRFLEFENGLKFESPSKEAQGLILARPTVRCRLDDKSQNTVRLEFVRAENAMGHILDQGSVICLNNWQWERPMV